MGVGCVSGIAQRRPDRVDLVSSSARLISIVGQAAPAHDETTVGKRRSTHSPAVTVRTG